MGRPFFIGGGACFPKQKGRPERTALCILQTSEKSLPVAISWSPDDKIWREIL
jgi:hypothetical protein